MDTLLLAAAVAIAALLGAPSLRRMLADRRQRKAIDQANEVIEAGRKKQAEQESRRHEERQAEANAAVAEVNEADDLQKLADIANRHTTFGKKP